MIRRRNHSLYPIKSWEFRSQNPDAAASISDELKINPLLAGVLVNRGYDSAAKIRSFLHPRLSSIKDPFLLKDMDKAMERLVKAVNGNEKICIFGDYDVDGVTSTALLIRFLQRMGKEPDYYIPNRISEGYGLNTEAIKRIARKGAKLLITVDNGISSFKEVALANSLGIDVIITDHHQAETDLPPAVAIVNPNRKDFPYIHTPLCGVGVAFKFIHAAFKAFEVDPESAKDFLYSMMDLVALGTVADIVPLTGENRTLVKYGLKKMETTDKVGLSTLLQMNCPSDKELTPQTISFTLAPRINAAGRADQASLCIDLLLTQDHMKAIEIARRLNRLNDERRKLEADILDSCLRYIADKMDIEKQNVLIVHGEGWHFGVVGIVASRLLERYHKPSIVLTVDQKIARGSGRSIPGFDIFQALTDCNEYLVEYGGHKGAVGLTLHTKDIAKFRDAMNEYAADRLNPEEHVPRLVIDAEVEPEDLTLENIAALSAMEPLGTGNPSPVFCIREAGLLEPPKVVGRDHLKLLLCKDGLSIPAIGFSMAESYPDIHDLSRKFDIAFTPYINQWRGYKNVELEIRDIQFPNEG
ncbi:single-stranded-DNA-specific exonuclease RecJ [Candidatus Sumerlaeota bacterium]|nr:single-stranded-DNA-specific exonuclease RecJ [Candidatus Sumerlaeota bacterium]